MGHLGVVLYEYLGEEYPEVLGSILGALKAIVNVIGMHKMTPPIKEFFKFIFRSVIQTYEAKLTCSFTIKYFSLVLSGALIKLIFQAHP